MGVVDKKLTANKDKIIVTLSENQTHEYQSSSLALSGLSSDHNYEVQSNTATVYQRPKPIFGFNPDILTISNIGHIYSNDVKILCNNLKISTIGIKKNTASFVKAPYIVNDNGELWLNFTASPNTLEIVKTGEIILSGETILGEIIESDPLSLIQNEGTPCEITLPEDKVVASTTTKLENLRIQISNARLFSGSLGVVNGKGYDITIRENIENGLTDAATFDIEFSKNNSYQFDRIIAVTLSGLSEYNEYVVSNVFTITQSPRQALGIIKILNDSNSILYSTTAATFSVLASSGLENIGVDLSQSVGIETGVVDEGVLSITTTENTSTDSKKEITIIVTGQTENGEVVSTSITLSQDKHPLLVLGDNKNDMSDDYHSDIVRDYNTNSTTFLLDLTDIDNVGIGTMPTDDCQVDIDLVNKQVVVTMPQNDQTPKIMEFVITGTSKDGSIMSASYSMNQNSRPDYSIELTYNGSTATSVPATATTLLLDVIANQVSNISVFRVDSSGDVKLISPIVNEMVSGNSLQISMNENYSYTDSYSYRIQLVGTTPNGEYIYSNLFMLTQYAKPSVEASLVFPVASGSASYSDTSFGNIAYTTSNVFPESVAAYVVGENNARVSINTTSKKVSLTFGENPPVEQTYEIYLTGRALDNTQITSAPFILTQEGIPAATFSIYFTDTNTTATTVSYDVESIDLTIKGMDIDVNYPPVLQSSDSWFDLPTGWILRDGFYYSTTTIHFGPNIGTTPNIYTITCEARDLSTNIVSATAIATQRAETTESGMTITLNNSQQSPLVNNEIPSSGDTIYLAISTTNVKIDSVVVSDSGISSTLIMVGNDTTTTNGQGGVNYSMVVPGIPAPRQNATTQKIANGIYDLSVGNNLSNYYPISIRIECGNDASGCLTQVPPTEPLVFTITINGHTSGDNVSSTITATRIV